MKDGIPKIAEFRRDNEVSIPKIVMANGEQKEIVVPPSKGYNSGELAGKTLIFDTSIENVECCNSTVSSEDTVLSIQLENYLFQLYQV